MRRHALLFSTPLMPCAAEPEGVTGNMTLPADLRVTSRGLGAG
jgi:hypothetical protein